MAGGLTLPPPRWQPSRRWVRHAPAGPLVWALRAALVAREAHRCRRRWRDHGGPLDVRAGVDLLFVTSALPAQAAQRAATQIPIVFAWVEDPVGLGLVQSYAQPSGNITGVTNVTMELTAKRLELFRDLVPGLRRVLYPYDATHAPSVALAHRYREAARHLGMELVEHPVRTEAEVQALLAQVRERQIDGIVQPSSVSLNIPGFIMEATAERTLPTMFESGVPRGARGPRQLRARRLCLRVASGAPGGKDPQRHGPAGDPGGGEYEVQVRH